jgi:galactokinase/mevalonate kinase-like predicted kinase
MQNIALYDGTNASSLVNVEDVVHIHKKYCADYLKATLERISRQETTLLQEIQHIVEHNEPVSHIQLLDAHLQHYHGEYSNYYENLEKNLITYAKTLEDHGVDENNSLIKAERVYYILSDVYARFKQTVGSLSEYDPQYKSKIDELENRDFLKCINRVLSVESSTKANLKWSLEPDQTLYATAPMKLALSSANNSDRHGAAKLEGSRVLNMAVNLMLDNDKGPQPTIRANIHLIGEPKLVLEGYNDLSGKFETHRFEMTKDSVFRFFAGNHISYSKIIAFSNSYDPFRFYKYSLVFSGIISCFDRDDKSDICEELWSDLMSFTDNKGLFIGLENIGPSHSGFSSSSAVMATLLSLLYRVSGQFDKLDRVYDLALLAENRLGLRSGWNDTYSLMPGIHDFYTKPTTSLPKPLINKLEFDTDQLEKRLWLIHTGLQRKATGRMNRRHEVYLSKDPVLYPSLLQSLAIHEHMVHCLHTNQYEQLGHLMTQYMDFRIAFDPEATNPYLTFFFDQLLQQGLIYGGLLAGAMGGGIAQVIVTDKALEDDGGITRMERAINQLREHIFEHDGKKPFANALYRRIQFGVNREGIKLHI